MAQIRWSVCPLCLFLPQDFKFGFALFIFPPAIVFSMSLFLSIFHPYVIHQAVEFCLCPASSVDINTQDVTTGYAVNDPSLLISTKCESVIPL